MPKQIVARVGEELHRKVKAKAAQQGLNITQVVRQLLEEWAGRCDHDEPSVVLGEEPDRGQGS